MDASSSVIQPASRRRWEAKRLFVHCGVAAMVATAVFVAIRPRATRVVPPESGSACAVTWTRTEDGTTLTACISNEGNINQIRYPADNQPQILWEGYCIAADSVQYRDFGTNQQVLPSGFGPATITPPPTPNGNPIRVKRRTLDGRFELSQYIEIRFQPRSIFVGMTLRNLDTAPHPVSAMRAVAPAIDGSAADDLYNQFGSTDVSPMIGRTGQAFQNPGPGSQSLLFGATEHDAAASATTMTQFQQAAQVTCPNPVEGTRGLATGGNRVLLAGVPYQVDLGPGQQASVGKFVYRMA